MSEEVQHKDHDQYRGDTKENEQLRQSVKSTSELKVKVRIPYQEYYVEIQVVKSRS